MNPLPLPTSSSSPAPTNPFPLPRRPLPLRRLPPPPPLSSSAAAAAAEPPGWPSRARGTVSTRDLSLPSPGGGGGGGGGAISTPKPYSQDDKLLTLLRQRKTEEAWAAYAQSDRLPNPTCLSRLVSQLSYQKTPEGLARAQSILTRLRDERQLRRLDANSLGLLAVAAAKAGQTLYASSVVKSMLRSGYLPHVKAWSAVVSRLAASGDDGPAEAVRLFEAVTRRLRNVADPAAVADSRPDTAAFNAVLNACANLGDTGKFSQLFDEMPEFGAEPDVLTYNVMIKLCARVDRKDLLVCVLEMILSKGIPLCMSTLNSLVAAYVGFGDLDTAEKIVQAMREGRRDLCKILRDANVDDLSDEEEDEYDQELKTIDLAKDDGEIVVFAKLLPNSIEPNLSEPPLLPNSYAPNSRIYTTLMKGYMRTGRVKDTVRMLEAMRHEEDSSRHPDHISYTTVISALVKAGSMDQARRVLAEMQRLSVPANRITYNILLKGYCQQLQMDKAKELIKEMARDAQVQPDVVSYNTLIDGCILIDDSTGALEFFNEMRARAIAPTKISYTTLMKAFASSGQPKLAHKVFDEMIQDPRVKPDVAAWNMLVEGYCKLGLVEEAKKVVQRMKENGPYPDVATYGSLASGITLARKPGEALLLWNEIKERWRASKKCDKPDSSPSLPPLKPDEGLLDALADICVRAAFFRKALEIVACMEENGISPNKTKYKRIYVEMHSRMFTSKHASQARQARRAERKRSAEAFKFWVGLPNSYYASEWHFGSD
ncbi:pentatricopeptide repeat-containing protein At3g09650, chloroplastic [Syzygium oleosum]|uniref:pentatricopeptide repeat-containing protein At3g09650, chloroplastic n=1 Tax=Syzygium oleosum TaxID=219896 RepID=UPI0024BA06E7|nr:pentatricopeptide repeat-containing protein At3g09650, chloroplastic [Syzygium oleosum]